MGFSLYASFELFFDVSFLGWEFLSYFLFEAAFFERRNCSSTSRASPRAYTYGDRRYYSSTVHGHLGQALERTHTVTERTFLRTVHRHLGQALNRTHTVTEGTILYWQKELLIDISGIDISGWYTYGDRRYRGYSYWQKELFIDKPLSVHIRWHSYWQKELFIDKPSRVHIRWQKVLFLLTKGREEGTIPRHLGPRTVYTIYSSVHSRFPTHVN